GKVSDMPQTSTPVAMSSPQRRTTRHSGSEVEPWNRSRAAQTVPSLRYDPTASILNRLPDSGYRVERRLRSGDVAGRESRRLPRPGLLAAPGRCRPPHPSLFRRSTVHGREPAPRAPSGLLPVLAAEPGHCWALLPLVHPPGRGRVGLHWHGVSDAPQPPVRGVGTGHQRDRAGRPDPAGDALAVLRRRPDPL